MPAAEPIAGGAAGQAASGETGVILCDQLAVRNGLRNSTAPWKCRSLMVTTTQLFAAAVAAITMSSGLPARGSASM